MVAIVGTEEVHVTDDDTSPVLLSPKVAVAVNCCVCCGRMKGLLGEMDSETTVSLPGKNPEQRLANSTMASATTSPHSFTNRLFQIILFPTGTLSTDSHLRFR